MKDTNVKVGFISLGCDKNRVDGEKLIAKISEKYEITSDASQADVLVVNTCAFLDASRREAIKTVFDYVPYKQGGKLKKIILTGCLPQKFVGELYDDFVEVDGFLGVYDGTKIVEAIDKALEGERVNYVGKGETLGVDRVTTTPNHYAYVKIADGCSNYCTYCLIPKIRGKFKSEPMERVLEECKGLGDVKELILVAQDTTKYGVDLYGEPKIVELIEAVSALENVKKIRLLYCYPDLLTDRLIEEFKTNPKLIKYVDIPFQHASDRILKLMNRKGSFDEYFELIKKLKSNVKGMAIRSTFIAGFPSETEEDLNILIKFLKKAKLFNAGFFAYSREKDTPAYSFKGQIAQKVKKQRVKTLYETQRKISYDNLQKFVGKTLTVVCDGVDYKKQKFFGRAYFNAPDVDGRVYISGDTLIEQGEEYVVKITKANSYDLYGKIVKKV